MAKERFCKGCLYLGQAKLSSPCKIGFICTWRGKDVLRDPKCKSKPLAKQAQIDLKKLQKEVEDLFQIYIRYRDNFTCVNCGKVVDPQSPDWKWDMAGGHLISRQFNNLLLEEFNCYALCQSCNYMMSALGTTPPRFIKYVISKHGIQILDRMAELMELPNKKFTKEELEKLKVYWTEKLEQEKKNYNQRHSK